MSSPQREKRDSPKVGGWGLNAAEFYRARPHEICLLICGVLSSYHDIKTEFSMVSPTHDRGEIPESDLIYRICQGDVQEPVS